MKKEHGNITVSQLELMKHAIGLDQVKAKPKRGKYTAYRNYFCTGGKDKDWEELVKCGVATRRTGDQYIHNKSIFYYVSDEGLKFMEGVLGFKIVESD